MCERWFEATAAALGRAIAADEIDPRALTEAFLERIGGHELGGRIYARTMGPRARTEAAAAAARAKAGARRGLLDGVPISWKDNFDTAGIATEAGSALLAGRVPEVDAAAVTQGTAAGLVALGKTHMSELAFSGLGLNPVTATPPCVNVPEAVAGGSSSGAAASVAFGLAPAAIGSDTGGSVRVPAAWNDLVGLKTTSGRLSGQGVVPLCEAFDTVGPLARSVEDCALLLAALEGGEGVDLSEASLKGLRLAVLDTVALDDLRPEPARAFEAALSALSQAGAVIETVRFAPMAETLALSGPLFTAEAWAIWREVIAMAPEKMFPPIYERFCAGSQVMAADYVAAWRRLRELRGQWAAQVAGYDAVLLPTSPILPPDAARLLSDPAYYAVENMLALRNTRMGNMLGLPALTLPSREPSCGVQIFGTPMGEAQLLRIGAAAEGLVRGD